MVEPKVAGHEGDFAFGGEEFEVGADACDVDDGGWVGDEFEPILAGAVGAGGEDGGAGFDPEPNDGFTSIEFIDFIFAEAEAGGLADGEMGEVFFGMVEWYFALGTGGCFAAITDVEADGDVGIGVVAYFDVLAGGAAGEDYGAEADEHEYFQTGAVPAGQSLRC